MLVCELHTVSSVTISLQDSGALAGLAHLSGHLVPRLFRKQRYDPVRTVMAAATPGIVALKLPSGVGHCSLIKLLTISPAR